MSKQSTSHLFMIEPESFYSNEQTSYTNHYQEEASDEDIGEITRKALVEFHNLRQNRSKRNSGNKLKRLKRMSRSHISKLVYDIR